MDDQSKVKSFTVRIEGFNRVTDLNKVKQFFNSQYGPCEMAQLEAIMDGENSYTLTLTLRFRKERTAIQVVADFKNSKLFSSTISASLTDGIKCPRCGMCKELEHIFYTCIICQQSTVSPASINTEPHLVNSVPPRLSAFEVERAKFDVVEIMRLPKPDMSNIGSLESSQNEPNKSESDQPSLSVQSHRAPSVSSVSDISQLFSTEDSDDRTNSHTDGNINTHHSASLSTTGTNHCRPNSCDKKSITSGNRKPSTNLDSVNAVAYYRRRRNYYLSRNGGGRRGETTLEKKRNINSLAEAGVGRAAVRSKVTKVSKCEEGRNTNRSIQGGAGNHKIPPTRTGSSEGRQSRIYDRPVNMYWKKEPKISIPASAGNTGKTRLLKDDQRSRPEENPATNKITSVVQRVSKTSKHVGKSIQSPKATPDLMKYKNVERPRTSTALHSSDAQESNASNGNDRQYQSKEANINTKGKVFHIPLNKYCYQGKLGKPYDRENARNQRGATNHIQTTWRATTKMETKRSISNHSRTLPGFNTVDEDMRRRTNQQVTSVRAKFVPHYKQSEQWL